jgi:hypothetical protein
MVPSYTLAPTRRVVRGEAPSGGSPQFVQNVFRFIVHSDNFIILGIPINGLVCLPFAFHSKIQV